MSYILDALRRANSERERGTVPTLLADPGPADRAGDDEADGPQRDSRAMPWVAGGLGAAIVAVGAVWLWPRTPEPVAAAQAQAPVMVQPQQSPPQPHPQVQAPAVQAPEPAATVPLSVPALIEVPRPTATAPVPAPASATPSKPAVMAERPVPTKAELPEDVRKQIPPIVTSGAMYSDTPANRMVIINGQVFHEGDKVTPELVLEQIMLKGAVLSFKGQRFSIGY